MLVTTILFVLLAYPLNLVLVDYFLTPIFYVAQFFMVILASVYLAVAPGFFVSLFPTHLRYSGIAVSYNISLALFGGTAPLIVTMLIEHHIITAPGIVLTIGGLIALVTLLFSYFHRDYY